MRAFIVYLVSASYFQIADTFLRTVRSSGGKKSSQPANQHRDHRRNGVSTAGCLHGYSHLAVSTDDMGREHGRCGPWAHGHQGVPPRWCSDGQVFFIQDPDGYKIEVLQRHGRYTSGLRLQPKPDHTAETWRIGRPGAMACAAAAMPRASMPKCR